MNDKIITHGDWQNLPLFDFLRHYHHLHGHITALPPVNEANGIVVAQINYGRWIAECPAGDGCAAVVSQTEPYFWCVVCANERNGGRWYNVRFPGSPKRAAIEKALLKRPVQNRNWEPNETVAQLEAENLEHGVG